MLEKIYKISFGVAAVCFFLSFLYPAFLAKSDMEAWQAFSVFVAGCVIGIGIGVVVLFISKVKRR